MMFLASFIFLCQYVNFRSVSNTFARDFILVAKHTDLDCPGPKERTIIIKESLEWINDRHRNNQQKSVFINEDTIVLYHMSQNTIYIDFIVSMNCRLNYLDTLDIFKQNTNENIIINTSRLDYMFNSRISTIKKIEYLFYRSEGNDLK